MAIENYKDVNPSFDGSVYIHPSAVVIGNITIGTDSSIWPLVAARGDVNHMRIGERSNIQDGSVLHLTRPSSTNPDGFPLLIGDDVTVGHHCMLHGCQIGDRVLIGMSATLLDGVTVENDVLIGAGTVVPPNKRLVSGFLYVGNPMKQVRQLSDAELEFLKQSAINYVDLKNEYLAAQEMN